MKKEKIPLITIVVMIIFIIVNFIFTSDDMDAGFWVRNLSSVILIFAMCLKIWSEKKAEQKE